MSARLCSTRGLHEIDFDELLVLDEHDGRLAQTLIDTGFFCYLPLPDKLYVVRALTAGLLRSSKSIMS